jgi:hypothetical protein
MSCVNARPMDPNEQVEALFDDDDDDSDDDSELDLTDQVEALFDQDTASHFNEQ